MKDLINAIPTKRGVRGRLSALASVPGLTEGPALGSIPESMRALIIDLVLPSWLVSTMYPSPLPVPDTHFVIQMIHNYNSTLCLLLQSAASHSGEKKNLSLSFFWKYDGGDGKPDIKF